MERFAGYTPGLMLVLGADISGPEAESSLSEANVINALKKFLQLFGLGAGQFLELNMDKIIEWLQDHYIRLKETLGGGMYGMAFQVDHPEYGNDIVLKVTTSDIEMDCIEEIYKSQLGTWSKSRSESSLPEIFEFGDLDFVQGFYYYLRPKYEMWHGPWGLVVRGNPERKMLINILEELGNQYFPYDRHKGNIGIGPDGQPVHIDPHCDTNPEEAKEAWEREIYGWIKELGPEQVAEEMEVKPEKLEDHLTYDLGVMSEEEYSAAVDHYDYVNREMTEEEWRKY